MSNVKTNTKNYDYLSVSEEDAILIIELNNPPNNLLGIEVFRDLYNCLEYAFQSPFSVIVLTGKGRNFSKGADLAQMQQYPEHIDTQMLQTLNATLATIYQSQKLIVAGLNGACLGGGLELAMACHLRLAAENSMLGLPETTLGLIPGLGGFQRMHRLAGEAKALELVLLGDIISAARAQEYNLVNKVLPKKDFLSHCLNFTKAILNTNIHCINEIIKMNLYLRNNPYLDSTIQNMATESFCKLFKEMDERANL